jgi:hypothetical protein
VCFPGRPRHCPPSISPGTGRPRNSACREPIPSRPRDVLTVNGGNGNLVEVTPSGAQIAVRALDTSGSPPGAGALFGLAVRPGPHRGVYYVDDATNTLDLLH